MLKRLAPESPTSRNMLMTQICSFLTRLISTASLKPGWFYLHALVASTREVAGLEKLTAVTPAASTGHDYQTDIPVECHHWIYVGLQSRPSRASTKLMGGLTELADTGKFVEQSTEGKAETSAESSRDNLVDSANAAK
ncbi:hypothetical protein FHL15_000482 [Xylaria flabelliformis]|uniref:Uncharacterized protein n=1 Tax=Xylaria flabelliformis TaxID=2512241 RepID=A0A553IDX0_9PEZI|nr:hypothetical protein FHL15_000482 [Xylaria flabelliformis]